MDPEVAQDLRAEPELTERAVVAGLLRGRGGLDAAERADLLRRLLPRREVDDDATTLRLDPADRFAEIPAAVLRRRREDVADRRAGRDAPEALMVYIDLFALDLPSALPPSGEGAG